MVGWRRMGKGEKGGRRRRTNIIVRHARVHNIGFRGLAFAAFVPASAVGRAAFVRDVDFLPAEGGAPTLVGEAGAVPFALLAT